MAGREEKARTYLRAPARRERILEAARRLFAEKGYAGARIREIARTAGIHQATLYDHFPSKEALFAAAVVEPLVEAMQGMYERAAGYRQASSRAEFWPLALASVERHLAAMEALYPLLIRALFAEPELARRLYRERIRPIFGERGRAMAGAVREGIDPEQLALFAFGLFFAVAMDRALGESAPPLPETARQLAELACFGFAPDSLRS
ncbi:MAG: TetR family transcriptional regulator [Porticoccaceae bacterium]|nr:MAG: TetR family transcriptional regulator [Porticoccaceae bacterium]